MSTESRDHRPFVVDASLESTLSRVKLRCGDQHCLPNGRISLSRASFLHYTPILEFADDETRMTEYRRTLREALANSGLAPALASIVVSVRSGYLKSTDVVYRLTLDELERLPSNIPLVTADRPAGLAAPHHGCDITASIVLARDNDGQEPSRPRAKGYWMTQVSFSLNNDDHTRLYQIRKLTPETRGERGLGADVTKYLEVSDSKDLVAPLDEGTIPILWLDEEVADAVDSPVNNSVSSLVQYDLAIYFLQECVRQFATYAQHETEGTYHEWNIQDIKQSVMGEIIRLAAGRDATDEALQNLLESAQSEPEKFCANLEDMYELRRELLRVLRSA